jgi:serine/threonine protein kinase
MRATKAQIEEGRRKKGLYETISVLGRGTSGTVKLCRFRPSQELVALKSIAKPQNGSDTEGKGAEDSFWKEVNALRKTGLHVNLAQLLDAFETSTKWYLVLAYQSGGDLLKRIERSGVFTEQSAATIILTILNSLHYLHAHGIVHRDVKPANLLMKDTSANAALVLVDFGSSFSGKASKQTTGMDEKSAMRTIAGTPFYLAPEIVKGQVICALFRSPISVVDNSFPGLQRKSRHLVRGLYCLSAALRTDAVPGSIGVPELVRPHPTGRLCLSTVKEAAYFGTGKGLYQELACC